jgi:D-3-phosphoglycerate dehydrogenase
MTLKILVITPIKHISDLTNKLEKLGEVTYFDDPTSTEIISTIHNFDAIFTNPNKSKVFIGSKLINAATKLKVICTASTGTDHIDCDYANKKGIKILSLTKDLDIIKKISSTAELAFALTLASLRHIVPSHYSVLDGKWDYTKFIGRQINYLTVGVIGYGRLGSIYANFCNSFGAKVVAFDPYKKIVSNKLLQVDSLSELCSLSNIISLHVHANKENLGMINKKNLILMKKDVIIVNTSRGDIIVEKDLVDFLSNNPNSKFATDVIADEVRNRLASPILEYAKNSNQVTITPHIGGMTYEAQKIAYNHAANKLYNFFN